MGCTSEAFFCDRNKHAIPSISEANVLSAHFIYIRSISILMHDVKKHRADCLRTVPPNTDVFF